MKKEEVFFLSVEGQKLARTLNTKKREKKFYHPKIKIMKIKTLKIFIHRKIPSPKNKNHENQDPEDILSSDWTFSKSFYGINYGIYGINGIGIGIGHYFLVGS